jgi:hypothetical protein
MFIGWRDMFYTWWFLQLPRDNREYMYSTPSVLYPGITITDYGSINILDCLMSRQDAHCVIYVVSFLSRYSAIYLEHSYQYINIHVYGYGYGV